MMYFFTIIPSVGGFFIKIIDETREAITYAIAHNIIIGIISDIIYNIDKTLILFIFNYATNHM